MILWKRGVNLFYKIYEGIYTKHELFLLPPFFLSIYQPVSTSSWMPRYLLWMSMYMHTCSVSICLRCHRSDWLRRAHHMNNVHFQKQLLCHKSFKGKRCKDAAWHILLVLSLTNLWFANSFNRLDLLLSGVPEKPSRNCNGHPMSLTPSCWNAQTLVLTCLPLPTSLVSNFKHGINTLGMEAN